MNLADKSKGIDLKVSELKDCIKCDIANLSNADVSNLMRDKLHKLVDICIDDDFASMREDFKYSKDDIDKIAEEYHLEKVCMTGTHNELSRLKSIIEFVYSQYIFYLSYWKSECGYHGWSWSEDDGSMKNQANITDGITQKFKEIYALILCGLGTDANKR